MEKHICSWNDVKGNHIYCITCGKEYNIERKINELTKEKQIDLCFYKRYSNPEDEIEECFFKSSDVYLAVKELKKRLYKNKDALYWEIFYTNKPIDKIIEKIIDDVFPLLLNSENKNMGQTKNE